MTHADTDRAVKFTVFLFLLFIYIVSITLLNVIQKIEQDEHIYRTGSQCLACVRIARALVPNGHIARMCPFPKTSPDRETSHSDGPKL